MGWLAQHSSGPETLCATIGLGPTRNSSEMTTTAVHTLKPRSAPTRRGPCREEPLQRRHFPQRCRWRNVARAPLFCSPHHRCHHQEGLLAWEWRSRLGVGFCRSWREGCRPRRRPCLHREGLGAEAKMTASQAAARRAAPASSSGASCCAGRRRTGSRPHSSRPWPGSVLSCPRYVVLLKRKCAA